MRALRFDSFGEPEVLKVTDIPDPAAIPDPAGDREAVVAVRAASVNPSDLKNIEGAMRGTVLPRVPGRDFAGTVVEGPSDWLGTDVWGTGGDLGFTRDGSHAERVRIPTRALVPKPGYLSFEQASTVGVNFVVGWLGAVETAGLDTGETLAVFGVSGGVGGAVAQIGHARGARVIGVDRREPAGDSPAAAVLREFVPFGRAGVDPAAEIKRLTNNEGVHVVFDAVGGVTTASALASLKRQGRLVVISAVGTRTVEIDLVDFYRNESRILGADSRKLDVVESGRRLAVLGPYFESGQFQPLPIAGTYRLDQGQDAYLTVARGTTPGRVVLCP